MRGNMGHGENAPVFLSNPAQPLPSITGTMILQKKLIPLLPHGF
jgi:hypothetical protein